MINDIIDILLTPENIKLQLEYDNEINNVGYDDGDDQIIMTKIYNLLCFSAIFSDRSNTIDRQMQDYVHKKYKDIVCDDITEVFELDIDKIKANGDWHTIYLNVEKSYSKHLEFVNSFNGTPINKRVYYVSFFRRVIHTFPNSTYNFYNNFILPFINVKSIINNGVVHKIVEDTMTKEVDKIDLTSIRRSYKLDIILNEE